MVYVSNNASLKVESLVPYTSIVAESPSEACPASSKEQSFELWPTLGTAHIANLFLGNGLTAHLHTEHHYDASRTM